MISLDFSLFSQSLIKSSLPFSTGIIPPVLLLCLPCGRKPYFWLRLLMFPAYVLLFSSVSTAAWLLLGFKSLHVSQIFLQYMLLLAGTFLGEQFLFHGSLALKLFNLLGGLAWYQIALFVCDILYDVLNPSIGAGVYYATQSIWLLPVYFIIYWVFIRRQNHPTSEDISAKSPELCISIAISLFLIAFNIVRHNAVAPQSILNYMCLICLILFYSMILLFRSGLLTIIRNESEMRLNQRIWAEKEKSLKLTAETANAISIKYHDLKHIVSSFHGADTSELMSEITDSLRTYEHIVATGNDTLDMVLTEQTLRFSKAGISFSCIADGSIISFMSPLDIISLFSNALDNAYEAVNTLPQGMREIYLNMMQMMGMVSIVFENPCLNSVTIRNGIPITTKQNKEYHGFGIKSICSVVEKYGGDWAFSVEADRFKLKILIPIVT